MGISLKVGMWISVAILAVSLCVGGIVIWNLSREDGAVSLSATPEERSPFTVLVAAKDRTSGLSDVMMLLVYDWQTGMTTALQLPRDTYFRGGSDSYRKLNGAPVALGMEEAAEALGRALGVRIDRYLLLEPDALCRAVDALGGVEVEIPRDMDYEDPTQGLSIHLKKGRRLLDGREAEGFVRYRSGYGRGDLDRLDAQKIFFAAFAERVMEGESILSAVRLAAVLLGDAITDLTLGDLYSLGRAVEARGEAPLRLVTAPGREVRGGDGGSYYGLSALGMEELLSEIYGEGVAFDPDGEFLHPTHAEFRRVYEERIAHRFYSSRELTLGGE